MTTISIALCTCNGERFLPEQLQSFLDQQRQPDELVVCDDASTDRTPSILTTFAENAPFPVRVARNGARLGVAANFAQVISLCSGDYIALSDQDDVWLPQKLAQLERTLEARPEYQGAFSDASLVSDDCAPMGLAMWQSIHFTQADRRQFAAGHATTVLMRQAVVTGATLMIRSRLREVAIPIPAGWMHDEWLALIASTTGGLVPIEDSLVLYRQHADNVIGGRRKGLATKVRAAKDLSRRTYLETEIARFRQLLDRLGAAQVPAPALAPLIAKIAHLERRHSWPTNRFRRWLPVFREWLSGGYHRYSRNWHNLAFDLVAPDERNPEPPR
ncbi:glycosyltransferase family 2 protein [Aromatoleum diolicum]|uniref:Glycosyltransferase n=1 Tax=Aromatoleum diolicum TaxID=75796 RepID=A0ABX1QGZ8_9RHOO|nr:glycosyltransferase family 2 protein [Aromatoleum diolicum]NMG77265.1 glycosyltransferase [Aromatoleum diolicum]